MKRTHDYADPDTEPPTLLDLPLEMLQTIMTVLTPTASHMVNALLGMTCRGLHRLAQRQPKFVMCPRHWMTLPDDKNIDSFRFLAVHFTGAYDYFRWSLRNYSLIYTAFWTTMGRHMIPLDDSFVRTMISPHKKVLVDRLHLAGRATAGPLTKAEYQTLRTTAAWSRMELVRGYRTTLSGVFAAFASVNQWTTLKTALGLKASMGALAVSVRVNNALICYFIASNQLGTHLDQVFDDAGSNGRLEVVRTLLPNVGPARCAMALIYAINCNNSEEVRLLLADDRVDPSVNNNDAIQLAADNGHTEITQLLLADPRVDPSANNNWAIRLAAVNGHVETVRLLLADPRVDPSAENNWTIQVAATGGDTATMQLLLADPRVDPSAHNNDAIRLAAESGHSEMVQLLLADPRVDPSANDNEAIQQAAANGHTEIVQLLLADPRVDPAANSNMAIRIATARGHATVVQALLAADRVDPSACDDDAALPVASGTGE